MIKRLVSYSIIGFVFLLVLIYYNYHLAQKRLREARQTQFSIELTAFPTETSTGQPNRFVWRVTAPESFSAIKTGIYWSYDSSPSALFKGDSPEAVNYANFTFDYATGLFQLPDTFDLDQSFNQRGVVYFRAYAQIDKDHLWTEEKQSKIN
ncbi:MAG: hypothetical protein WAV56_01415 [Microgenomates group bacterium]